MLATMIKLFKRKTGKEAAPVKFPGFLYASSEISAFAVVSCLFIISLKTSERIVKHKPEEPVRFYLWLKENGAREVTDGATLELC